MVPTRSFRLYDGNDDVGVLSKRNENLVGACVVSASVACSVSVAVVLVTKVFISIMFGCDS